MRQYKGAKQWSNTVQKYMAAIWRAIQWKNTTEQYNVAVEFLSPSSLFTDYASYTLHGRTKYTEKANGRSATRNIIHHVRDQNRVQNSRQ